jgi:hypothetical protein
MQVSGEEAHKYQAVRRDSLLTINQGVLILADDETGEVKWTDRAGREKSLKLGASAVRILPAYHYGR